MAVQHDQLMKKLLATFPDQLLRLAAPELAECLDLESMAFEPEEHYPGSPTGRERRADLVGRAWARTEPGGAENDVAEALIHVEIELEFRTRTAPRLLRYNRGLSLKYELTVHTIVLYLRGGPPGPHPSIYEERSMGRTVVAFHYHSMGLSRASAAEYLARTEPLAWALAALMRPANGQSRAQLGLACVRRIVGARELSVGERDLLFECVLVYASLEPREAQEFDRIMAELNDEEVRAMRMSMAEWWRQEGVKRGLEKGEAKGRAEGQRDLVLDLLKQRFGSLSSEARSRLSAIESTEELTRLAAKAFQVRSLEELGLA